MAPVLDRNSIDTDQKTTLKGELVIWRTKNQARDQGTVQLKDSVSSMMKFNLPYRVLPDALKINSHATA
jgi:hypothetical protein